MKVIILSAATGGGHNTAARALKEYIVNEDPNNEVEIVDFIEITSKILSNVVTIGYKDLAMYAPSLFGYVYRQSDKKNTTASTTGINIIVKLTEDKVVELIEQEKPDIIVSVHPFSTNLMSKIKTEGRVNVPVLAVITDFTPHMAYIGENINAYATGSYKTSDKLINKYGVNENIVYTTGLPILDKFHNYDEDKKSTTYEELGFSKDKPTLLIMAGSFGVRDILKIYENISEIDLDFQVIVITGKNKSLYEAFQKILDKDVTKFETYSLPKILQRIEDSDFFRSLFIQKGNYEKGKKEEYLKKKTSSKPTKLFYFVNNVEDYMHVSDVIITKPGGLTTSEAIACSLPMALFDAIPGQEEANANYLCEKGMAIQLKKGTKGAKQIQYLFTHKDKIDNMRQNCKANYMGNACENLYTIVKKLIK